MAVMTATGSSSPGDGRQVGSDQLAGADRMARRALVREDVLAPLGCAVDGRVVHEIEVGDDVGHLLPGERRARNGAARQLRGHDLAVIPHQAGDRRNGSDQLPPARAQVRPDVAALAGDRVADDAAFGLEEIASRGAGCRARSTRARSRCLRCRPAGTPADRPSRGRRTSARARRARCMICAICGPWFHMTCAMEIAENCPR